MCLKRNSKSITLNGRTFLVDSCLRDLIYSLNQYRIETLACCCGHGKYPMTIIYKHKQNDVVKGNIYDFVSGWRILKRTRKFYIRDKKGLFYIPEVIMNTKGFKKLHNQRH